MIINLGVGLTGAVVFLFIFWKRLKEDYSAEIVFRVAFNILVGVAFGYLISFKFFQEGFLWFEFVGALAGLGMACYRFKVRFYETLESMVIGLLPWMSFIFLKNSVVQSSFVSFSAFLIILVLIFLSHFFDQHYRNFSWYRSGKIGFSGLAVLVSIFIIRLGVAMVGVPVISFLRNYEAVISTVAASVGLILLFNLGRQKE